MSTVHIKVYKSIFDVTSSLRNIKIRTNKEYCNDNDWHDNIEYSIQELFNNVRKLDARFIPYSFLLSQITESTDQTVIYGYSTCILYNNEVWGDTIYIDYRYHKHGYGTTLLSDIIQYIKTELCGYTKFKAKTLFEQEHIKRFYIDHFGFIKTGELDNLKEEDDHLEKFSLIELSLIS